MFARKPLNFITERKNILRNIRIRESGRQMREGMVGSV